MRPITTAIIHCSETYPDMDIGRDEIRHWHVVENGWDDVGYHHIIRRDGVIENGRPWTIPGAHARGMNAESLGICLVGGKARDGRPVANFTRAQFTALASLVDRITARYPNTRIIGHNDVPGTKKTCPNFDVAAYIGVQA